MPQEIEDDDEALLDSYVPQGQLEPGRTLADLIMEKIGQAEQPAAGEVAGEYSSTALTANSSPCWDA